MYPVYSSPQIGHSFTSQCFESGCKAGAADGVWVCVERNATAFLVAEQSANGSWNDDPMSTALAVWGLSSANTTAAGTGAAIDDGVAWLLANQLGDGSWSAERSSSWRSTGVTSETTGYAVLALNESGLPASNASVQRGTSWLLGTYDEGGSWGYTRASAVAIEALLALGVEGPTPSGTVNVSLGTGAQPALVTKSVTVDDADPRAVVQLTESERSTLRSAGDPIIVAVETSGTGQFVVAVENDQVVDEDEYLRNTGGA